MVTKTKTTPTKPAPRKKRAPQKPASGTQPLETGPSLVAFKGALWHAREFRAQGSPAGGPDEARGLRQRFALWHEPPLAKLLTLCLPQLPAEIPPLKYQPDPKLWYLMRQPTVRKKIFFYRALGYSPERIARFIKQHYPGFDLEPSHVKRLLYLFFRLPDPRTGAHLEILACAQALAQLGVEFPEFDRYARALLGTLREKEYYRHLHQPLTIHQQLHMVAQAKTEVLFTLQAASYQAQPARLRTFTAVLKLLGDLEQQLQAQQTDEDLLHDHFVPLSSLEDQELAP